MARSRAHYLRIYLHLPLKQGPSHTSRWERPRRGSAAVRAGSVTRFRKCSIVIRAAPLWSRLC